MSVLEIERKWLVDPQKIPYDLSTLDAYAIEQAYISFYPTIRIRNINNGEQLILTIKTHPKNSEYAELQREETEIPLSEEEYGELLKRISGNVVCKTRYVVPIGDGLKEEIDLFSGALEGLALMEIEFPDTASALNYPNPEWVEADVTYDKRYKNSFLAQVGLPERQG